MKELQETFDSVIQDALRLEKVGTVLIQRKLKEIGIDLTVDQLAHLEQQLSELSGDILHFEIDDGQIARAGFDSEDQIKQVIEEILSDFTTDIESFITSFHDDLPDLIRKITEELSGSILERLKGDAQRMLREREVLKNNFEINLNAVWGGALDLLAMFIVMALEAGESLNASLRQAAVEEDDVVFEVLTRLHARGCRIASEVLILLRSGYADGAHARWRSLHEVSVVGSFVSEGGRELAERYLLHEVVESYKAALQYQKHCSSLGYEPMTEKEIEKLRAEYKRLLSRFGEEYGSSYGWAVSALNKRKPNFSDIEEAVSLDHLRPYYKMASHNVHANPKGVFFALGLSPESSGILLAGPSNAGLFDPGHSTALSLGQITITLLTTRPNIDRLVISNMLLALGDEIGNAFAEAEQSIDDSSITIG